MPVPGGFVSFSLDPTIFRVPFHHTSALARSGIRQALSLKP
jgi:hypothetical protein